jgi:hypothetical protein
MERGLKYFSTLIPLRIHSESVYSAILGVMRGGQPAVWSLLSFQGHGLQPDAIIYRIPESLFASQLALGRLYGNVAEQKLNLLQFAAGLVTEAGASSPEVVWRERWDLTVLCLLLHDTPNDLGAEAGSPNSACLVDRKKSTGRDSRGLRPGINPSFHPIRDWNGSYVAALADEIGDDPVFFSLLQVFNAQRSQFRPA